MYVVTSYKKSELYYVVYKALSIYHELTTHNCNGTNNC